MLRGYDKIYFAFLFLVCSTNLASQSGESSLQEIIIAMEEGNYITNSLYRTGLYSGPIQKDSQYLLYDELKECVSDEQIHNLISVQSPVVQYYSILIFMARRPNQAMQFIFDNEQILKTKSVTNFLNYCQAFLNQRLIDALHFRIYDMILEEEIDLSARNLVRFLQLRERRLGEASEERRISGDRGF